MSISNKLLSTIWISQRILTLKGLLLYTISFMFPVLFFSHWFFHIPGASNTPSINFHNQELFCLFQNLSVWCCMEHSTVINMRVAWHSGVIHSTLRLNNCGKTIILKGCWSSDTAGSNVPSCSSKRGESCLSRQIRKLRGRFVWTLYRGKPKNVVNICRKSLVFAYVLPQISI